MKTNKKKRSLTLIEIMIVIVLIGLIGSVIGVNMKGSLDEGRAFKTEQAMEQIKDILMLEIARGTPVDDVVTHREAYLANSGLVKNAQKFLNDGWGVAFEVTGTKNGDIKVRSERLITHKKQKRNKIGNTQEEEPEEAQ